MEIKSGFQQLRRVPTPEEQDQKLKDVSQMYEKQFLREMMKSMRSTVTDSGLINVSQGEKIFREQLDQEYVDKWGDKGGIGLSDMIYKQLIEKFGPALGITAATQKPHGPLKMDEKSIYRGRVTSSPQNPNKAMVEIQRQGPGLEEVKSPWAGKVTSAQKIGENFSKVEIEHDDGLKSQLAFRGELSNVKQGQEIQAGQGIGVLSPEARSLHWSIDKGNKTVSE